MMMNEQQKQKEKSICGGGVHCLKLNDKEHSTQFIHLNPVTFSFLSLSHTHTFSFDFSFSLLIADKLTTDIDSLK
jgi:hypothetical protein